MSRSYVYQSLRGVVEPLLLFIIGELLPIHGYEIARELERRIAAVRIPLTGDGSVGARQFETPASIMGRIGNAIYSSFPSTQGPSPSQRAQLRFALEGFQEIEPEIDAILAELASLEAVLEHAGAPFTPNRKKGGD